MGRAGAPGAASRQPAGWPAPKHPLRQIIDAIRHLVRSGCAWRLLPHEFPPPGTVSWWFAKWAADGTLARVHDTLREQVRLQAGRSLVPSAAIIDSQSVRAGDTVPRRSRGWDAGKKVNGRKRHLAVDTPGLLVVMVTAASIQDRDAGWALLWRLRASFRGVRLCWANGGYAGRAVAWAVASEHLDLPEPVDRTILDAGDDLVAQQRLRGIGVGRPGVPMPDAADHEVSKAVS